MDLYSFIFMMLIMFFAGAGVGSEWARFSIEAEKERVKFARRNRPRDDNERL